MKSIIELESIYVVGDIHGRWPKFNDWLQSKKPNTIFQVGDFGYWPRSDNTYQTKILQGTREREKKVLWKQCGIKNPDTDIYWCSGNHEDHEMILKIQDCEICDKVFYMPFASTLKLSDGRTVLFIGGAATHNPGAYEVGFDCFPALEQVKLFQLMDLPNCKIDIVISHTCPYRWINQVVKNAYVNDTTCEVLDRVLIKYQPSLWYFGHFHTYKTGFDSDTNTRWFALNKLSDSGWFEKLK